MDWQRFRFDFRLQSEARFSCLIHIEAYNVTARTFYRELIRLAEMGFITFSSQGRESIIELDFGAIGKY